MSARLGSALRPLLVVAGHDSSGGAGVDADREAARDLGLEANIVVTAWTRQDDAGLRELGARDPEAWLAEALAFARRNPSALKLGLLPGTEHIDAAVVLCRELREHSGFDVPVVLDPVLSASRGGAFLDEEGVAALIRRLPELAPVLTPNLGEAATLTGISLDALADDLEARVEAALALGALGAPAVLLKGGHGVESPLVDLVWDRESGLQMLERPRIAGAGIRGSGCRYATAVAAGLASGLDLLESARRAGEYVAGRIAAAAASAT